MVTPYNMVFGGVTLAVLALAPLPGALYLRDWLRRRPPVAIVWFGLGLLGCAWAPVAFYARLPVMLWASGIVVALSWWFLATHTNREQETAKKDTGKPSNSRDAGEGGADA